MNSFEPVETSDWNRISPKQIWVLLINSVWGVIFIIGPGIVAAIFLDFWGWLILGVLSVWFVIDVLLVPRQVRAVGYKLREDDLVYRKGIFFQRSVAVPYGRLQLVDITRGPLERSFGLATLKLVTAAATTGVSIAGLPFEQAEQLRDHLVSLAETRRAGL